MAVNRQSSFTLVELLVVIGVVAALLVIALPAINSLSKSSGRKAAIQTLLGTFEQARAQAIKDGLATYVVFATFSTAPQPTIDRYNYKSWAIYEDDPANPSTPKQLTNWKTLSTGVALRAKPGTHGSITDLPQLSALSPVPTITFSPDPSASPTFHCVKFNGAGEVETPQTAPVVTVFEGSVNGAGVESITSAKDSAGEPKAVESILIARLTGRARRI